MAAVDILGMRNYFGHHPWMSVSFFLLGLILAAMYLQGKTEREKVWKDEGTLERFLGSVPVHRANKK